MIDSHAHLWQAGSLQTRWLERPPFLGDVRWQPLRASFTPAMLRRLLAEQRLEGVVLVEAAAALEETEALLAHAADNAWVLGLVGWLPLADARAFDAALQRYADRSALVGVRHQIHAEPDPDWVLRAAVVENLDRLAAAGLAFDYVGVNLRHLDNLARLADACPDLIIVLDHLNSPPIAEGTLDPWRQKLAEAARRPNVVAKLSGLETCSNWASWSLADWRPFLDHALEVFGADRLMLGSNWPVSTLAGSYADTWRAHRSWLAGLSEGEQVAIASKTARRVYRLRPAVDY